MRQLVWNLLVSMVLVLWVACSGDPGGSPPPPKPTEVKADTSIKKGDLIRAVIQNDPAAVLGLLSRGANVNENIGKPGFEVTPLIAAVALKSNEAIVQSLITHGAATYFSYGGYTVRDFAFYGEGDNGPIRRLIIQKDIQKSVQ